MRSWIAIAVLLAGVAQDAMAQSVDYRAMYGECLKKAGRTNNASVAQCSAQTFKAAGQEIDRLYSKIYQQMTSRNAGDAKQFASSQKSWIAYRDSHCKLAGAYVGSPMYGYCPMQSNISRVNELRELALDSE
jgi:uncharacterized protein YecT (DUF1311 family)